MSENTHNTPQSDEAPESVVADSDSATQKQEEPVPAQDESTIGTGTSMALGCVAGTVLLIGFGLLFLFLSTLR